MVNAWPFSLLLNKCRYEDVKGTHRLPLNTDAGLSISLYCCGYHCGPMSPTYARVAICASFWKKVKKSKIRWWKFNKRPHKSSGYIYLYTYVSTNVHSHSHTHTHKNAHALRATSNSGIIAYSSELGEDICAYSEFNDTIPRLIGGIINTLLATNNSGLFDLPPTIQWHCVGVLVFGGISNMSLWIKRLCWRIERRANGLYELYPANKLNFDAFLMGHWLATKFISL